MNSLTYGALYLMTDILATSLYTGLFLNALVEGASCLLIVVTVDRWVSSTDRSTHFRNRHRAICKQVGVFNNMSFIVINRCHFPTNGVTLGQVLHYVLRPCIPTTRDTNLTFIRSLSIGKCMDTEICCFAFIFRLQEYTQKKRKSKRAKE